MPPRRDLVPYLAWNLIAVLVLWGPTAGKYVLQGHKFMAGSPVNWHSLIAWFAGWPVFPADAPLWFLRDMLILSMVMLLLDGWRSARNYGKPPEVQPREDPAR